MQRALLVGGGAREHAIAKRLSEGSEIFSVMKNKNPGIARLAKGFLLESETNVDSVVAYALKEKADAKGKTIKAKAKTKVKKT